MKNIISITEARKKIFHIADEVQKPGTVYILTENGRAKAVMLSAEEFESWQETLEVYRQFPNLDKDSKEAWQEFERGETTPLEDILKKEGFVLADEDKKKYVSRRSTKKGRKGAKKN